MGFVKRKGTKAFKTLPSDFESIKCEFVKKVEKVVNEFFVPDSLVINWDQTGCQLVLSHNEFKLFHKYMTTT